MKQIELSFRAHGRGGARVGAGRPKGKGIRHTPHRARPVHRAAHPVHVTMRAAMRSLRRQQVARTVLEALRAANRVDFRIAHYSVQENHLHLIVEASDERRLSSGMRGLAIRMARRVNKALSRRGTFWADRWHGTALASPRQVRNALVYVLQNRKKHVPPGQRPPLLDPLSSAQWFDGFATPRPRDFESIGPPCIAPAQSWLLRAGWRKRGLIQLTERPQRQ